MTEPTRRRKWIAAAAFGRLLAACNGICELCGIAMSVTVEDAREALSSPVFPEVDHIIPLAKGGADDESNMRTICRRCNRKKGAR